MRGLSTVAAFVVFLTAFAVVMFSVFYFYNTLLEAAQRGVETIYPAVTHDASVGIDVLCSLTGGRYIFYIVTDEAGRVMYDGDRPPLSPRQAGALHIQGRAERRRFRRRLGCRGRPLAVFLCGQVERGGERLQPKRRV
jgi:hypothetical protein